MTVKLQKTDDGRLPTGTDTTAPKPMSVRPLQVSGIVLTKAAIVAALQIYAPVSDIEPFEDGQRFLLTIETAPAAVGGAPDSPADS